jgi:hypothetical protein
MALGLNYIGLIDEISVFDRVLTDQEIRTLHALKEPLARPGASSPR